eukprot:scaffold11747_cov90-Isochrysis_galbana.AAC.3
MLVCVSLAAPRNRCRAVSRSPLVRREEPRLPAILAYRQSDRRRLTKREKSGTRHKHPTTHTLHPPSQSVTRTPDFRIPALPPHIPLITHSVSPSLSLSFSSALIFSLVVRRRAFFWSAAIDPYLASSGTARPQPSSTRDR